MMGMYVREGDVLVRREVGGKYTIRLPDHTGTILGYWIKPSPFAGTLRWEWVITNMDVTVVTGMSSGYTRTKWGAKRAVRRAQRFWAALGYEVLESE